jgi:hypothetical protein
LAAFALSLTPLAAANAALPQGARAPDFTAQGALGGKPFSFNLRQALKRGPVVLYFYPKAFTQGARLKPMPLPTPRPISPRPAPR